MVVIVIYLLMVFSNKNLKQKNSEIKRVPLSLGNISGDFSSTNATKTGLYGSFYDFAVDYVPLNNVETMYDIHRYLMKKKPYCIKCLS